MKRPGYRFYIIEIMYDLEIFLIRPSLIAIMLNNSSSLYEEMYI